MVKRSPKYDAVASALQESERKLLEAQKMAQLGYWIWDVKTGEVEWSEVVFDIFRLDPKTFHPRIDSILALSPWPEDHQRDLELIHKAMESREMGSYEQRFLRPDGSIGYYHSTFQGKYDADGVLISLVGTVMDITERKHAELALRENEARFKSMVENLPLAIVVLSGEQQTFRYINPAMFRMFGYSLEDIPDLQHWCELAYPDEAYRNHLSKEWLARVKQSSVTQSTIEPMESVVTCKDGSKKHVLWGNASAGECNYSFGYDITREVQLESQLHQAQKIEAMGQLAGGVAHDFNNLLMGIMGYASLCQEYLPPAADHPLRTNLDEITKISKRAAALTRQLLAFARKQTIAPKVLDLNDAVAGMLKLLRRMIGEDIELIWKPGANVWPVRFDPSQIDQILANLCVNARDAIADIGNVTLETSNVTLAPDYCASHEGAKPGDYVLLSVSDDGCGMESDVLAHIFEPFFTTKAVGAGTGLGLATVFGIVQQNHGVIDVKSAPGKGTTFNIYISRVVVEGTSSGVEHPEEIVPRGHGETILLVEDEQAVRSTCAQFLVSLGYKPLVAETSAVALNLAARHSGTIELIMTDVVMPGMNGRELAERLVGINPDAKVLFMSGYTANIISRRGVLDDGLNFIQKPFSRDDLARKVRLVLDS